MTTTPEKYDAVVAINVDVQNDFCPGGSLAVPEGDQVVAPLNNLNRWVRDRNGLVVFTRDWHPEETTHFDTWPRHCVQYRSGAAFHEDLELIDPTEYLNGHGGDLIVSKGMGKNEDGYSGMLAYGKLLDRHGVTRELPLRDILDKYKDGLYPGGRERGTSYKLAILIGGLATDYCVRATTLEALDFAPPEKHFNKPQKIGVFVVTDAMRGVDLQPGDSAWALNEMYEAGAILTTTEDIIVGRVLEVAR